MNVYAHHYLLFFSFPSQESNRIYRGAYNAGPALRRVDVCCCSLRGKSMGLELGSLLATFLITFYFLLFLFVKRELTQNEIRNVDKVTQGNWIFDKEIRCVSSN